MSYSKWLVKLAVVLMCAGALLGPGDSSWGDDGFYVVGGGSPWRRNGANIYYKAGNVGIGTDSPSYPLHIVSNFSYSMYAESGTGGTTVISAISTATSGPGWGVFGQSNSTDSNNAYGVFGTAAGAGAGVKGSTNSTAGYGVYGVNSGVGGIGISGLSSATSGGGWGVYGTTSSTDATAAGVEGFALSAAGVRGITKDGFGVVGVCTGGGYGVYSFGNIGASGTKTAIVATSQGPRKLYAQESPEVWFEDFGEGQLAGGTARIDLDPLFRETITIDDKHPIKVFIQLNDDCNGVYVHQRQASSFQVTELAGGKSKAHFTYRVVAKRKGFETVRLDDAPDLSKIAELRARNTLSALKQ